VIEMLMEKLNLEIPEFYLKRKIGIKKVNDTKKDI
jgi:hypothetical protein